MLSKLNYFLLSFNFKQKRPVWTPRSHITADQIYNPCSTKTIRFHSTRDYIFRLRQYENGISKLAFAVLNPKTFEPFSGIHNKTTQITSTPTNRVLGFQVPVQYHSEILANSHFIPYLLPYIYIYHPSAHLTFPLQIFKLPL